MIPFTLSELAHITNGTLVGENIEIKKVSTDSRLCVLNSLFVVLKGKNFDSYDFIQEAIFKGALALMINKFICVKIPQIIVKDTIIALGKLSVLIRKKSKAKILAVTGSSGKTTVKEMTANILSLHGNTVFTNANLNNNIGVPLTILSLNEKHKYLIVEMGANAPGEIDYLTKLVKPQSALINNITAAHLLGFGSVQGVAKAKGEIFNGLINSGTAIINYHSNNWFNWKKKLKNKKILFYSDYYNLKTNIWASNIHVSLKNIIFDINTTFSKKITIKLPLLGMHNVSNALAAAALAMSVNIPLNTIKKGLSNTKAIIGRLFPIQLNNKQLIIDDTYNANYGSFIAAINVLSKMPGYLIIVIGDIAELGNKLNFYYEKIIRLIYISGINKVISFGKRKKIDNFLGEHFYRKKDLVNRLLIFFYKKKEITVLIKGSRINKMEKIVSMLKDKICVNFN